MSAFYDYLIQNCSVLLFYLGFYVAFNTVQVISQRVVERAEETPEVGGESVTTLPPWPLSVLLNILNWNQRSI